jgi:hypothetical protein
MHLGRVSGHASKSNTKISKLSILIKFTVGHNSIQEARMDDEDDDDDDVHPTTL